MSSPTLPAARTLDPMDAPGLRWGILGAGWIARQFVDAARTGTRQQVAAVGSRDAGRAAAFVAEVGGDVRAHGSYEELVADPDIDVVYVATPHSEHRDHALAALAAGKPVLVEKAFTATAAQAREVVAEAERRQLFCMEAMWTRFLPQSDVIRQVLEAGMLGRVHTVFADHGQRLHPGGPQRLWDPALAGGALLDLGVYPVSFVHGLFGAPERVTATGTLTELGVDDQESMTLTHAGGTASVLSSTMLNRTPTTATICGTEARLELSSDFYAPTKLQLIAQVDGRDQVLDSLGEEELPPHRGFRYELAEVARRISAGETQSPLMPPSESVAILETLEEIRRQVDASARGSAS